VRVSCGTVGGLAFEGLAGHHSRPTVVTKPPLGKLSLWPPGNLDVQHGYQSGKNGAHGASSAPSDHVTEEG
jgi:hypothetical protein